MKIRKVEEPKKTRGRYQRKINRARHKREPKGRGRIKRKTRKFTNLDKE